MTTKATESVMHSIQVFADKNKLTYISYMKATIEKLPNGKWVAFHAGKSVTAMCDTKKECLELIKGQYILTTNHEATYP